MSVSVIVCGGRDYYDRDRVFQVLSKVHRERVIARLIQGGAKGADDLARQWAEHAGVECVQVDADWSAGRKAGPLRNLRMLEMMPDGVIAFPGGIGTRDMVRKAAWAGVPVMDLRS